MKCKVKFIWWQWVGIKMCFSSATVAVCRLLPHFNSECTMFMWYVNILNRQVFWFQRLFCFRWLLSLIAFLIFAYFLEISIDLRRQFWTKFLIIFFCVFCEIGKFWSDFERRALLNFRCLLYYMHSIYFLQYFFTHLNEKK